MSHGKALSPTEKRKRGLCRVPLNFRHPRALFSVHQEMLRRNEIIGTSESQEHGLVFQAYQPQERCGCFRLVRCNTEASRFAPGCLPSITPWPRATPSNGLDDLPSRGGLLGECRRSSFTFHRIHCGVCSGQKAFDVFTIVRIDSSANADGKHWPLAIMGYAVADAPRHKVGRLRARFR
jgi:hypothetical protein